MEGFSNMKETEFTISSKQIEIGLESFEVKNATPLIDGEGNDELDWLDGWKLRGAIRRGSIDNNLNFSTRVEEARSFVIVANKLGEIGIDNYHAIGVVTGIDIHCAIGDWS